MIFENFLDYNIGESLLSILSSPLKYSIFYYKSNISLYTLGEEGRKMAHSCVSTTNSFMTAHLVIFIYRFYVSL